MIELIEAEPAVRVGLAAILGGRAEVEEARLALGVGVALLFTSATDGLGLTADVGDLTEAPESGEVTEERVGPVVVETGFVAVFAAGVVAAGLAPGARDALRLGAAGVVVPDGRGGGGMDVLLLAVAVDELAVFRMVVVAAGALKAAPAAPVAFVAREPGAVLAAAAPVVPAVYLNKIIRPDNH